MSEQTQKNQELRTPQDYAATIEQLGKKDVQRVMDAFGAKAKAIFVALNRAAPEFTDAVVFSFGKDGESGKVGVSPDLDAFPYQAQLTAINHPATDMPKLKNSPPAEVALLRKGSKQRGKIHPSMQIAFSEDGVTQTQGFGLRSTFYKYSQTTEYSISPGGRGEVMNDDLSPKELVRTTAPVDLGFMGMISEAEVPLFVPAGLGGTALGEFDQSVQELLDRDEG